MMYDARANVGQSPLKNVEGADVTPSVSRFLIPRDRVFARLKILRG